MAWYGDRISLGEGTSGDFALGFGNNAGFYYENGYLNLTTETGFNVNGESVFGPPGGYLPKSAGGSDPLTGDLYLGTNNIFEVKDIGTTSSRMGKLWGTNLDLSGTSTFGGLITATSGITGSAGHFSTGQFDGNLNADGGLTATSGIFSGTVTSLAGTSTFFALQSGTGQFNGLLTGNSGLTISSGSSTLQDVSATTGQFNGLLEAKNGLNVMGTSTLQALTATTGDYSGLLKGSSGLSITSGPSNLQNLTATSGQFSSTLDVTGISTLTGGSNILGQVYYEVKSTNADFSGGTLPIPATIVRLTSMFDFRFPSASSYTGQRVVIVNRTGDTIQVLPANTDASAPIILDNGGKVTATSDGTEWLIGT